MEVSSHSGNAFMLASYMSCLVFAGQGGRWPKESHTWPRYCDGEYVDDENRFDGESMLALTQDEYEALAVVVLRCDVREETYGAHHQKHWKKVGLSRAY